ncbi:hypothetical protein HELRODRAFT_183668 [Helobdella robusta]|uniref:Glucose-methanol-choline oxidoreductase N-terminal domain-containing protein n=1 Tax=Helobdella robusta TaxID=6412 RepID=T1FK06_HELRO|nr:hypothetical protein HELRODRAFT_183668 [Helobdella robusta]ESO10391.1 hypothetical protein HELRODRAFT_183668 [Helobdella robusta]
MFSARRCIYLSRGNIQQMIKRFIGKSENISEHDYIVVGSGSAGSVIANRLATFNNPDKSSNQVLLLEAGPSDDTWKIKMPAALVDIVKNEKYSVCYETTPQPNANNRVFSWPRGKVMGGCSSLNAMVYMRGHPYDYDRWEQEGAKGWSYADCLPYFKKSQTHQLGGDDYRGDSGPLYVSRGKWNNPLFRAFVDAGLQAGYQHTEDCNGFKQEGFGHFDMTLKNGMRCSTSAAYIDPIKAKRNLKISTNSMATKVIVEGSKAVGVEYKQNDATKYARARKEVILCGGSINSPQLLLLSGIGNADELRKLGIPCAANLPGVGENLQDHLEVCIQYKCSKPVTLYKYQWKFPWNMVTAGLQWFIAKSGAASTTYLEAGAFIRSSAEAAHPDIQIHFLPAVVVDHPQKFGTCHAYQGFTGTLKVTSRGNLKLKSTSPFDPPLINPNYLQTEKDVVDFRTCVRLTTEVFSQRAFDDYRECLLDKNLKLSTDDEIDSFVRSTSETAYHPCGTAKMGSENDKSAVVDSKCRVLGIDKLRVVDASIMPSILSGNLNAPVIMMAEKAADMILGVPPLPKLHVPVWKPNDPTKQR